MQVFSKFILTKLFGWKLKGDFPRDLTKFVLIGAPHTSWIDFPLGLLVRSSYGIKINFLGKKELFKPPFGFIFRALGGAPVERSKSTNFVDAIVTIYSSRDEFRLALSPEGTRKKVGEWKTGFYYIAKGANVPVVMGRLDYGQKSVTISKPYYVSENKEADFKHFHGFYKGAKGYHPELF